MPGRFFSGVNLPGDTHFSREPMRHVDCLRFQAECNQWAVAHELGTLGRLDRKSETRPAQKVNELMLKLLLPLTALLAISGCCQLFGVCTSASVHTSISSPQQFVQQDGSQNRLALEAPGQ